LDYLTTHTNLSPIWRGFVPGFVDYNNCLAIGYDPLLKNVTISPILTPAKFRSLLKNVTISQA
jgi:hypothetical protein